MKALLVHAVLAAAALAWALSIWLAGPEADAPEAGAVELLACAEGGVAELRWEDARREVVATPLAGSDPRRYWLVETRKSDAALPIVPASAAALDAGVDGGATAGLGDAGVADVGGSDAGTSTPPGFRPAAAPKPFGFVGNGAFDDYLDQLTPLRAVRELGAQDGARRAEFALDAPDGQLTVRCDAGTRTLAFGGRTFGSGHRYVEDVDSGIVYLVDKQLVQRLVSARHRFMQREPHAFDAAAVERLSVTAGDRELMLLRRAGGAQGKEHWVDAQAPERRNALYDNWLSRVGKLRLRAYLPRDAEPGDELDSTAGDITPPTTRLTLRYVGAEGPLGSLEIKVLRQGEQAHYYGRSESTLGWAVMHQPSTEAVLDDVEDVLPR